MTRSTSWSNRCLPGSRHKPPATDQAGVEFRHPVTRGPSNHAWSALYVLACLPRAMTIAGNAGECQIDSCPATGLTGLGGPSKRRGAPGEIGLRMGAQSTK
jgi:hypothetical protein